VILCSEMPGKTKQKKPASARVSRRITARSSNESTANLWGFWRWTRSLLPEKLRTVFRYQRTDSFATGGGVYAQTEISMNSPYDPLYTVGGGICTGFNTLLTLYSRFFVKKARIQAQFLPSVAASVASYILPVRSDEAAAGVIPTADMITEGQESVFSFQAGEVSSSNVIRSTLSPSRFQGLAGQNKEQLSGYITTDPTIQPAWYVGIYSVGGTVGQASVAFTLVEYDTELYRPNTLSDA